MRGAAVALVVVAMLGCKRPARPWVLPSPASGIAVPGGARLRAVAMDGRGRGVAAWELTLPGRTTVQVAEEGPAGTWLAQDPLAGANNAPAVAAGADGALAVVWVHAEGDRSGVFLGERPSSGLLRFETAPFARGAVEPFIAASPKGDWLLAYCQPTRSGWGIAIAERAPGTPGWQRPHDAEDVVSPASLFANQPRVAIGAAGRALVTWYQSEGVPLMTYVSERASAGTFSHPLVHDHLSAVGAPVSSDPVANPKPALGPSGQAAVAWVQDNGRGKSPVYLATRDAHGAWTKPRDLDDSLSSPSAVSHNVELVFSARGELYVAWLEDGAAVAARRASDGRWIDGGRSPARLSSSSATAYGLTLAAGGSGGVVAAWVEMQAPHEQRIAARRTGYGPSWEAVEWLSPAHAGEVGEPRAAMGARDRTLVGWAAGAGPARIVFAAVD